MATIINTQQPVRQRNSGYGFLLGVLLFIIFAVLFFYYAVPGILTSVRTPQFSVPSNINVNVHTNK